MYKILLARILRNKFYLFLILLITIFIIRSHTFLNEFYDIDELGSMVAASNHVETGNTEHYAYGKMFQFFFYYPFKLFGTFNWQIIRLITVILIAISCVFIFYATRLLKNEEAALFAAFFYAIFTGTGHRDHMVLCAELIFNFYIIVAFYLFSLSEFTKYKEKLVLRTALWALSILFSLLGFLTKIHAIVFILFYALYFIFGILKTKWKRLLFLIIICAGAVPAYYIFYKIYNSPFLSIDYLISSYFNYITREEFALFSIIKRFSYLFLLIGIPQTFVWFMIVKFFLKKKFVDIESEKKTALYIFSILSLIAAFITLRFFPHYFIQFLLPGCICAGIFFEAALQKNLFTKRTKTILKYVFIFNVLVSFTVYYSLTIFKFIKPDQKEINFQMIFPNGKLINTISWINKNVKKNERIFIWGDGAELYYFTKKIPPVNMWVSTFASSYIRNLKENFNENFLYLEDVLVVVINNIEKHSITYLVDIQGSHYHGFGKYPISAFPPLKQYIENYFTQVFSVDGIIIYKKRQINVLDKEFIFLNDSIY